MTINETIEQTMNETPTITRDIITAHELKTLPLSHFYTQYKKLLAEAVELEAQLDAIDDKIEKAARRYDIAKEYHGQVE